MTELLKKLAKRVEKELEQAEDYCTQAMLVKHCSTSTSELFSTLSSEEITHAEKLLREGQKLLDDKAMKSYDIKEKDAEHDAEHVKHCAIWEWEQRIASERIAQIKYKLSTFRSM